MVAERVHFLLAESGVVVEVDLVENGLERKLAMKKK
jgi:hypothetical protein